ncbi:Chromatin structure remodeling complex protein sfh1 [Mortierella sp. AM989]|nr:Chromatin structure remodeling complex protein sfh1 [Mortierella sp. AM989]
MDVTRIDPSVLQLELDTFGKQPPYAPDFVDLPICVRNIVHRLPSILPTLGASALLADHPPPYCVRVDPWTCHENCPQMDGFPGYASNRPLHFSDTHQVQPSRNALRHLDLIEDTPLTVSRRLISARCRQQVLRTKCWSRQLVPSIQSQRRRLRTRCSRHNSNSSRTRGDDNSSGDKKHVLKPNDQQSTGSLMIIGAFLDTEFIQSMLKLDPTTEQPTTPATAGGIPATVANADVGSPQSDFTPPLTSYSTNTYYKTTAAPHLFSIKKGQGVDSATEITCSVVLFMHCPLGRSEELLHADMEMTPVTRTEAESQVQLLRGLGKTEQTGNQKQKINSQGQTSTAFIMSSWVNHTSATMQNHSSVHRPTNAGSDSGSPAPSGYSTRGSSRQQQPQQQQQSAQPQQYPAHPQHQFRQYQPSPVQQQQPHHHHQQPPRHPSTVPIQMQSRYPAGQGSAVPGAGGAAYSYNPHASSTSRMTNAYGTFSTYASRIKEANSALILPPALGRRAKRAVVSMAESDEDDWDFDDSPRNTPTRHQRQQAMMEKERLEKEKKAWVRRPRKTRHIFSSPQELEAVADQDAILVPIRLDIDTDDYRLRDSFTWNVNEQLLTPEKFAEILCDDLDLSSAKFVPEIAQSIRNQIAEFEPIAEVQVPTEGSRVVIQLDLHVGGINLRDRFEWDVGSDLTPEEFARQLTADLGIGGEFVSMIAHEIHEQLYRFKQDRILDRGFETEPLFSGFRPTDDGENWSPALETLTTEEYEKILEDRERSIRRNRRATTSYSKRRGVSSAISYNIPGTGYASKITKRGRQAQRQHASLLNLKVYETWQCRQCGLGAGSTYMIRSGPAGEKTLCNTCGLHWAVHGSLPQDREDLFRFNSKLEIATPVANQEDNGVIDMPTTPTPLTTPATPATPDTPATPTTALVGA